MDGVTVVSGLIYRREDGVEVPIKGEAWTMRRVEGGQWALSRYIDGVLNEQYAYVDADRLGIALSAISCGYQPPHFLRRLDTLTAQTPPEGESVRAA